MTIYHQKEIDKARNNATDSMKMNIFPKYLSAKALSKGEIGKLEGFRFVEVTKDNTKKYTCPDCGLEHSGEHHPPYCQDCIFKVTL